MKTVQSFLTALRAEFAEAGLDTPDLDARLLLQDVMSMSYEDLLLSPNDLLNEIQDKKLKEYKKRRLEREPVSRILGMRGFWKSDFKISSETLDPRADSETLVEAVIEGADKSKNLRILDLGTGSGCLLLSVLEDLPKATGLGIDISAGALEVAEENAKALNLGSRCSFMKSDIFKLDLKENFDVIISNPPYISKEEMRALEPEVKLYDPSTALFGGEDGLDYYRHIAQLLPKLLTKKGRVFLEIGTTQAKDVQEILAEHGFYVLETLKDLGKHDRCVVACYAEDKNAFPT